MYTIRIQTPNKTHYIKDFTEYQLTAFEESLNAFLMDDSTALFSVEVPEGRLILPFDLLMSSEITIY